MSPKSWTFHDHSSHQDLLKSVDLLAFQPAESCSTICITTSVLETPMALELCFSALLLQMG